MSISGSPLRGADLWAVTRSKATGFAGGLFTQGESFSFCVSFRVLAFNKLPPDRESFDATTLLSIDPEPFGLEFLDSARNPELLDRELGAGGFIQGLTAERCCPRVDDPVGSGVPTWRISS